MRNYNQTLQTNNSSLEEIITQLNNMPDAGSSDPVLQDKTVTPTTSQQTVVADSDYDGLGTVTVNAMPTTTQATPIVSIDSNGKITATATQVAGYVSAGTKSGTKQLTTQAAKTITPSTSSQTAVAKSVYTTGAITVGAIPSNYEDVGTETNVYTTKLATLETAITALETELEGKASGGSGGINIETCSVVLNGEGYAITSWVANVYENGEFTYIRNNSSGDTTATINNVVCGSIFECAFGSNSPGACQTNGASVIQGTLFHITASAGETATISFIEF